MHEYHGNVSFQADIDEADLWLGELRHRLMDRREKGNAREKFSDYADKALRLELEDKVNKQQRCNFHVVLAAVSLENPFTPPVLQVNDLLAKCQEVSRLRQRVEGLQQAFMVDSLMDGKVPLLKSLVTAIAGGQLPPGLQHHSASLR